jgi:hypothetical protein
MKSYIKVFGPPIEKAIKELQKLAEDLPTISKGEISRSVVLSGKTMTGDFDFAFEWAKEPDEDKLLCLIFNIDEVLGSLGCRYTRPFA